MPAGNLCLFDCIFSHLPQDAEEVVFQTFLLQLTLQLHCIWNIRAVITLLCALCNNDNGMTDVTEYPLQQTSYEYSSVFKFLL